MRWITLIVGLFLAIEAFAAATVTGSWDHVEEGATYTVFVTDSTGARLREENVNEPFVSFTNVPPGDYAIQAITHARGLSSEESEPFALTVPEPSPIAPGVIRIEVVIVRP